MKIKESELYQLLESEGYDFFVDDFESVAEENGYYYNGESNDGESVYTNKRPK